MTQTINQNPLGLPVTLASGAVLAPGEVGVADLDDAGDRALVDADVLGSAETIKDLRDRAKALGIDGTSRLKREELEHAIADAEAAALETPAGDGATPTTQEN